MRNEDDCKWGVHVVYSSGEENMTWFKTQARATVYYLDMVAKGYDCQMVRVVTAFAKL